MNILPTKTPSSRVEQSIRKTPTENPASNITSMGVKALMKVLSVFAYVMKEKTVPSDSIQASLFQWAEEGVNLRVFRDLGISHLTSLIPVRVFDSTCTKSILRAAQTLRKITGPQGALRNNNNITAADLKVVRTWSLFVGKMCDKTTKKEEQKENSRMAEKYYGELQNAIVNLGEPELSILMKPQVARKAVDQSKEIESLKKVVETLTGESGTFIRPLKAKEVKERRPKTYARYLELRRHIREKYKQWLRSYITSNGQHEMPTSDVRAAAVREGIMHNIPEGFDGMIGVDTRLRTTTGRKLSSVPAIPDGTILRMNSDYSADDDNTFVYQILVPTEDGKKPDNSGIKVKGRWYRKQQFYTEDWVRRSNKAIGKKVMDIIDSKHTEQVRNRWRMDLRDDDVEKRTMAAMVEILYQTAQRIGSSRGMAHGTRTYGLSALLREHVRLRGKQTILLEYPGKDAVKQSFVLNASDSQHMKRVVKIVRKLCKDKKKDEKVFRIPGTLRMKDITGQHVNRYLKSVGAQFTNHKFRHLKANIIALPLLTQSKLLEQKDKGQILDADVNKEINSIGEKVGKELGHVIRTKQGDDKVTGATALRSYISPEIVKQFYDGLGVRYPAWLEKTIRGG